MTTKQQIILTVVSILTILALTSLATADSYELFCVKSGEVLDLPNICNPAMSPRTGPLNICMKILDNGKKCPANINICNHQGLKCSSANGSTISDLEAPNLTINSPIQDMVYQRNRVLVDLLLDERADLYYMKNHESRPRWYNLCRSCQGILRERVFDEGLNNVTFWAQDLGDNSVYETVIFYIDSRNPRITTAEPRQGFASGDFEVNFNEENPKTLILNYGNSQTGFLQHEVNISSECFLERSNYQCSTSVNLSLYDNQDITYFFELLDIADSSALSRETKLKVDYTSPIFNSVEYISSGRNGEFIVNITEENLKELSYIDHSEPRSRPRRICSRTVNGICNGRTNFQDGSHDIEIIAIDEAGNNASYFLSFITDFSSPRIYRTNPTRGYASGLFYIDFQEANPLSLILYYGNTETGFITNDVNITNQCAIERRGYTCEANVSLDTYNNQDIEYFFNLTDVMNRSVISRTIKNLKVDSIPPLINSVDFIINGRRNTLIINITEENFDSVSYIDNSDSRSRERRLCFRLTNGICERSLSLRSGVHELTIIATDEAGNSAMFDKEITI